jgi:hypothetical protein
MTFVKWHSAKAVRSVATLTGLRAARRNDRYEQSIARVQSGKGATRKLEKSISVHDGRENVQTTVLGKKCVGLVGGINTGFQA